MYRSKAVVEEADVDEIAPTRTMRQNARMWMLWTPAGKRHWSDMDMWEMYEEEGGDGIPAPCTRTDVDAVYQVVREPMENVCAVYEIAFKYVVEGHEDNGRRLCWGT